MAKFKVLKAHCLGGGRDVFPGDEVNLPDDKKAQKDLLEARVRNGWLEPIKAEAEDGQDETKDAGDGTNAGQDETEAGAGETEADLEDTTEIETEEPAEAGAREERPAAPRARRGGGSKGGK